MGFTVGLFVLERLKKWVKEKLQNNLVKQTWWVCITSLQKISLNLALTKAPLVGTSWQLSGSLNLASLAGTGATGAAFESAAWFSS